MAEARFKISLETTGQLPNTRSMMQHALRLTAEASRQEWVRIARQRLRTTAKTYISSIGPVEMGRGTATIRLRGDTPGGKLANALEQGAGPFDLKRGLLKSPKVSHTKEGNKPYIHVPFQLKTPGGGARGAEPSVMPRSIYRLASQLGVGEQMKLPKKYEDYGIKTRLSPDIARWGHYTWKTSPYQGITRTQTVGGAHLPAGKSAYMTFRTVSKNSDPSSWIHPGFRARNCMEMQSKKIPIQSFKKGIRRTSIYN